ncbi:MAG: UvrD-helicase domain-containing protein [Puniceicoccales bacterium]|jgi:ATP-dependent exoDNAse (exonuclease V) beta subunit|nr:UvrD-helicase domain-containing protein [Puniceicoccales bacterium]
MPLPDQLERDAFAQDLERNFSVIAPAGVGKTTAIAERIANFVLRDARTLSEEKTLCKKLVAVTYTEKAAKEIKDRVLANIFKVTECAVLLRKTCMERAELAFFGTIHAFASKFLKEHCAALGLRDDFEIAKNEDSIWAKFLLGFGDALRVIPSAARAAFLCTHSAEKLLIVARECNPCEVRACGELGDPPPVSIGGILAYEGKTNGQRIQQFLQLLREWDDFRSRGEFFPMPDFSEICSGGAFVEFCKGELRNFLLWKKTSANFFVRKIACAYEDFRMTTGKLRYDDLINFAVELLKNPSVIAEIEDDPYRIILDEAQDTDWQQFMLLLGVSQANLRGGVATDGWKNFPDGGHFSMVGDPQQSIYCDRTDVRLYVELHDRMAAFGVATPLTFSVTMRCPEKITAFVNGRFPSIFSDVKFVPLTSKPGSKRSAVKIFKFDGGSEKKDEVRHSAEQTAKLFFGKVPSDFGVGEWSEVAILAPRKDWLLDICQCFATEKEFPAVQTHFSSANDNLAYPVRWLAACLKYVNNSADGREFAGILREIFGIKSTEIINHFKYGDSAECARIDASFAAMRSGRHAVPLAKFLLGILDFFKIFQRIEALHIFPEANLLAAEKRTIELCYCAEASGMNSVEAENFLVEKMAESVEDGKINPLAVQTVTFHKSKGLEWPVVVLPFMFRRRQLSGGAAVKSMPADERLKKLYANECRLLYVACTRAKSELLIVDDSEIFGKNSPANEVSSGMILFGDAPISIDR